MTKQQYDRWKDFALRMARACFNRSRRPSPEWIVSEVEDWFDYRGYQFGDYNSWDQDRDSYLCDDVTEFFGDHAHDVQCRACDDCDDNYPCICWEREGLAYEQYEEQWLGPVRCCLRAGIDTACPGSGFAGVLGFRAGDLRAMYPEGVPDWVSGGSEPWNHFPNGEVNGVFADMADSTGLVL